MKVPALWTGKVWIGSNYQRPLPNLVESHDAQLIQKALLNNKNYSLLHYLLRICS